MVFFEMPMTILILLDISAVIVNGVIAFVLKKHKKTRIVTFFFIYCLSISDVMVGAVSLVMHSFWLHWFLSPYKEGLMPVVISGVFFRYSISLSGSMVFVIAIDRCIHMKYLTRYREIITQFRARVLMMVIIIVDILLIIPLLLISDHISIWYELGLNTFHTTGIFVIYAVYVKTYLTIKKQVATLKIDEGSRIMVQGISGNRKQSEGRSSNLCESNECITLERSQRLETNQDIDVCKSVATEKDNTILELKQGIFVLPVAITFTPSNIDNICNDIELKVNCPSCLENVKSNCDNKIQIEYDKRMARKQPNRNQEVKNKVVEKFERRKVKPDMQFRKATWMILLSLSICYMPSLINNFYMLTTRVYNYTALFIAQISLISNSSLNAVILIVCNREIKRNIKAIFRH